MGETVIWRACDELIDGKVEKVACGVSKPMWRFQMHDREVIA